MDRSKKIVKTSIVGIIVNIVLAAFKAFVGLVSGSVAVILDAVNNLSDVLSSAITIVGTKLSTKKPDKKHPYGHGRVEYITSAIISFIVLITGVLSLKESIGKIVEPHKAEYNIVSIIVIVSAIAAKIAVGIYFKNSGKKLNAQALIASGTDAMSDALLSAGTLVAVIVNMTMHWTIEGYIGVIISAFIIKTGVEILKDTFDSIIGERADTELTDKIKAKLCEYEDVYGCYDLTLHNYGPEQIIGSAHIEVPDDMRADKIHRLTRKMSADIYGEFGIVLTIGVYAVNKSEEAEKVKAYLIKEALSHPGVLQIHGFYLDTENKSVTFDLVTDFKADADGICEKITDAMEKEFPQYTYHAVLDSDYSD